MAWKQEGPELMRKTVEGQVTIFISLIMMCMFALLGVLVESARTAGARWYLQTAVSSALDSVFSQYHRELWDSYRLLFAEYEEEEELAEDFSRFLKPYLETGNWYPIKEEKISAEELRRATDAGGAYFEAEILEYMKYGVWKLDFDADTVQELWNTAREAGAVKQTAERYRAHGKEALKLEKALEKISECLSRQRSYKTEGLKRLGEYDGSGFRREMRKLIGELKRMPGLVQDYERQANSLAGCLEQSRKAYEGERADCTEPVQQLLEQEIQEYEAYVAEDGARRQEITALSGLSEKQEVFVAQCIQESEEIDERIDNWESDDEEDDGPDLSAMWSPLKKKFDNLSIPELSFAHGVKDKEKEGWLNQVEAMYQSGLLELVVPEGTAVSSRRAEPVELPSGQTGSGKSQASGSGKPSGGGLFDHVLVNEYCGEFFWNFCGDRSIFVSGTAGQTPLEPGLIKPEFSAPQETALAYEVEYLIGGELSDRDNLTQVVHRLLAVREGLNLIHILSDGAKRAEVRNLAMVITGAAAVTPLLLVTSFFIMSVWALGESLMDVRGLLAGRKVPVLKTAESWTLGLDQLLALGQNGSMETGGGETGLSYLSWLKILLLMDDKAEQEYRMMDLIQMNLALRQENFRMRNGVYQTGIKGEFLGKHVFFSLGFVERLLGQGGHTYPMTVRAERRY